MRLKNFEDMDSFERVKRRAKKHDVKVAKATEALVESLSDQNRKISNQLLVLTKLYRAAYRLLPASAQAQVDNLRQEIDSLGDLEVHP